MTQAMLEYAAPLMAYVEDGTVQDPNEASQIGMHRMRSSPRIVPRAVDPLLRAGGRIVPRNGAPVVPSALYLPEDGRLFSALGTSDLYYPCRAQSLAGGRQSPGRAGTRRPYEPGDDAALYQGDTEAERKLVALI
jgi:hypothetical protein